MSEPTTAEEETTADALPATGAWDNEPLDDDAEAAIAALTQRQWQANGLLMRAISFTGGQVEDGLKLLPATVRAQIDKSARAALERSYAAAGHSRSGAMPGRVTARLTTDRAHQVLATISGALGGLGGLPTALVELPIATTVIFRAVQGVAEAHGEDPMDPETRMECLAVFGAGGPGTADDGVDTTFIGARLSLSGSAIHALIGKIAPRFAAVLGQKLASQAVPVLGAAAGAGTNYAFVGYYTEMAHVHFGLRAQARMHGDEPVLAHFHKVLAEARVPVAKK